MSISILTGNFQIVDFHFNWKFQNVDFQINCWIVDFHFNWKFQNVDFQINWKFPKCRFPN